MSDVFTPGPTAQLTATTSAASLTLPSGGPFSSIVINNPSTTDTIAVRIDGTAVAALSATYQPATLVVGPAQAQAFNIGKRTGPFSMISTGASTAFNVTFGEGA